MNRTAKRIALYYALMIASSAYSMDYWNSAKASLAQTYIAGAQSASNLIVSAQRARSNPNLALATPAFFLSECTTGALTIWAACKGKNIKYVYAFGSSMILSALGAITFAPAWDCGLINHHLEKETLSETNAAGIKKIILRLPPATIPPDYYTELAFKAIKRGRDSRALQDVQLLKHLMQFIPDINVQEPHKGHTLLLACCKYMQDPNDLYAITHYLLKKKADPRIESADWVNACEQLLFKRSQDTHKTFKLICNHEISHNYEPNLNKYLLFAAKFNRLSAAIFLINQGIAINAQSHHGTTALHLACDQSHTAMVEYLLYCGADKTLRTTQFTSDDNEAPSTPLDLTPVDAIEIRQMLLADKRPQLSAETRKLVLQESMDKKPKIVNFLRNREMGKRT